MPDSEKKTEENIAQPYLLIQGFLCKLLITFNLLIKTYLQKPKEFSKSSIE